MTSHWSWSSSVEGLKGSELQRDYLPQGCYFKVRKWRPSSMTYWKWVVSGKWQGCLYIQLCRCLVRSSFHYTIVLDSRPEYQWLLSMTTEYQWWTAGPLPKHQSAPISECSMQIPKPMEACVPLTPGAIYSVCRVPATRTRLLFRTKVVIFTILLEAGRQVFFWR